MIAAHDAVTLDAFDVTTSAGPTSGIRRRPRRTTRNIPERVAEALERIAALTGCSSRGWDMPFADTLRVTAWWGADYFDRAGELTVEGHFFDGALALLLWALDDLEQDLIARTIPRAPNASHGNPSHPPRESVAGVHLFPRSST